MRARVFQALALSFLHNSGGKLASKKKSRNTREPDAEVLML